MARTVRKNDVKSAEVANTKLQEDSPDRVVSFIKDENGFVGTACCVSLKEKLHVVIMAPTAPALREALKYLELAEESSPELVLIMKHAEVYKSPTADVDAWKKGLEIVWVYSEKVDLVYMCWRKDVKSLGVEYIGDANKKTEREARLLLRTFGWNIKDCREVEVDHTTDPDEEIPF